MNFDKKNAKTVDKINKEDIVEFELSLEINQTRHHRKRRIDKKWSKYSQVEFGVYALLRDGTIVYKKEKTN